MFANQIKLIQPVTVEAYEWKGDNTKSIPKFIIKEIEANNIQVALGDYVCCIFKAKAKNNKFYHFKGDEFKQLFMEADKKKNVYIRKKLF